MHYRRNQQVRPDALRQRVREFPRDDLLRGIARVAAQQSTRRNTPAGERDHNLGAIKEDILFQLAGICVTHGNNHRSGAVDDDVVADLIDGLYNVWPLELEGKTSEEDWQRVLSRTVYQQMPYQESPRQHLTRSLCLLGSDPRFGEPVFDDTR